jgi:hypothetical protein
MTLLRTLLRLLTRERTAAPAFEPTHSSIPCLDEAS